MPPLAPGPDCYTLHMSASARSSCVLGRYLREPVNSLTHAFGVVLSAVGLIVLLALSEGEPWRMVSFTVYGISLIVLYTASTLLHALKVDGAIERALRIFDHAAIFGLIAGTYTPVTLLSLRAEYATLGWVLLRVVWGFALLGILFKVFWIDAPRWLSVGMYLMMGWMALAALLPLIQALPAEALLWLFVGGAFYSIGALVYAVKWPDLKPHVFGYHELWHLFVLAGSISHFMMMLGYVLPNA